MTTTDPAPNTVERVPGTDLRDGDRVYITGRWQTLTGLEPFGVDHFRAATDRGGEVMARSSAVYDRVVAATPGGPVFDARHDTHSLDDAVGYDVIRSTTMADGVRLEVTDVIVGANRYADALRAAKAHRVGRDADGHRVWGYTATRYACGCRWIAQSTAIYSTMDRPPVFIDHPDA